MNSWIQWVIGAVVIIASLVIIAVVLLQQGRRSGISGAISGGADSFLSKSKARTFDAALARWTKWIAVIFFLLIIAANVVSLLVK